MRNIISNVESSLSKNVGIVKRAIVKIMNISLNASALLKDK